MVDSHLFGAAYGNYYLLHLVFPHPGELFDDTDKRLQRVVPFHRRLKV